MGNVTNPIINSSNAALFVSNFTRIGTNPVDGSNNLVAELPGIPITTSDGTATGTLAVSVKLTGAGTGGASSVFITGAANQATGQVALSTSASTVVAVRATRRSVTIKNIDTAITVYIGPATVTALNGMELKPGESIPVDTTALIQGIAVSGTPRVAYYETYD